VGAAQVLAGQRVKEDGQQHEGQCLAQPTGTDERHGPGAHEAADQGRPGGRRQRVPAHLDALGVLGRGPGRAEDRGGLVGAEQRGGRGGRVHAEQGRHEDQASATHDGIDEARQQRGDGNGEEFEHREKVRGGGAGRWRAWRNPRV
jgi:hypothetical protein